ncbi:MAG: choice-of-anchor Q domain-containing protein [Planctomycetota bacterium]
MRGSPCVDAGTDVNNYSDIEGNARPFDFPGVDNNGELPEFDMGAYELVPIESKMQLTPQKLNCKSKGNWVKAHITLPEGFYAEDIDVNEPAVAYPMETESEYIKVISSGDGLVRLEIAFDRQAFCDSIIDDYLDVTVIGSLTTGRYFYGIDTIRIITQRPPRRGRR